MAHGVATGSSGPFPQGDVPRAALAIRDLHKSYGDVEVLRGVSLVLGQGEIHALVGGNGSGKSTMVKVLAGVEPADAGELEIAGRGFRLPHYHSTDARDAGLSFVHQQPTTFPELTVAENLFIDRGFPIRAGWRIPREAERLAEETLRRFHIDADPNAELWTVSPAVQTMIVIARALWRRTDSSEGVLVLDEPTVALPADEVELLLDALRTYARAGQTILLISHRLEEVLAVADRISVLRDGDMVAACVATETDHDELVEAIVGAKVSHQVHHAAGPSDGEKVLDATVSGGKVTDVAIAVRRGEIVGLTGLMGAGTSTLLRLIFGSQSLGRGSVEVGGTQIADKGCSAAMKAGVAYIPPDRAEEALFPDLSVAENLTAASVGRFWRGLRFRRQRERASVQESMSGLAVKAPSEAAPISLLSGGNQQKVVLARWLRREPQLLLLDEPTQGVDVGARAQIWEKVLHLADEGTGILIASSDVEELARICDRILVMSDGRITHEVGGSPLDPQRLVELAHGVVR